MITRFRLALVASVLATMTVVSLEHSRAAGQLFPNCGRLEPSVSEPTPVAATFGGVSRTSRPREIASGSESGYVPGQQIVLNIRPCRGTDGEFVTFRWPFKRNVVGSVNCAGSQVAIVQIEQR